MKILNKNISIYKVNVPKDTLLVIFVSAVLVEVFSTKQKQLHCGLGYFKYLSK